MLLHPTFNAEFTTGPEASKPPPQQNTDFKLTKCVTIRTQDRSDLNYELLQYLHMLSGEARCLGKCDKSDWKLPNEGQVLLHIDIRSHQVYLLPLLITPFPCIYLISFNLDEEKKALKSIHNILKDVYSYSERVCADVSPAVFLVGLQTEEKDRSTFSGQLKKMLETRSYNTLIVPAKGGDPYWTSHGAELNIVDEDNFALLCGIQGNCCHPPTQLTYQSLARHCELHHQFNDGEPFVLYKDVEAKMAGAVQDAIENPNFDHFIEMLHSFGLIVYHTFKELKQSETVVVRQPQSLCQLLAEVQKLSKTRESVTIADLLRTTMINIHGKEKEEWLQKFCNRSGLVIETSTEFRTNYIFVMGLDPKFEVPERAHYSVDPLLVTYRPPSMVQKTGDCLLPSPLFPAFVTAFLKKLKETNPSQTKLYDMKRHYLRVGAQGALHIHVVEREQFIEIGLQQFDVLPGRCYLNKLQRACHNICSIVSESAICAAANLSLGSSSPSRGNSNIHLGFMCNCDGTPESVECFLEFNQEDNTSTGSKCKVPQHPTPGQRIWFSNIDEIDDKVCLQYMYCLWCVVLYECVIFQSR